MSPNRVQYEAYGRAGYRLEIFDEASEGYLVIHPEHGKNEWEENRVIGLLLAAAGEAVELLPNKHGRPSPDALRNGEEWEFKTIYSNNMTRGIQNALRKGKYQASNILCFIKSTDFHVHEIARGIYNAVKFDEKRQIQRIGILFHHGKSIEISRIEVLRNLFFKKFLM